MNIHTCICTSELASEFDIRYSSLDACVCTAVLWWKGHAAVAVS